MVVVCGGVGECGKVHDCGGVENVGGVCVWCGCEGADGADGVDGVCCGRGAWVMCVCGCAAGVRVCLVCLVCACCGWGVWFGGAGAWVCTAWAMRVVCMCRCFFCLIEENSPSIAEVRLFWCGCVSAPKERRPRAHAGTRHRTNRISDAEQQWEQISNILL
jgi:hypothetical protein